MTAALKQSVIDINMKKYRDRHEMDKFHELEIKPFLPEINTWLFMVRYNDVRLVGTPPESIGKFGADTDNWVWPRHAGDFFTFKFTPAPTMSPADFSKKQQTLYTKTFSSCFNGWCERRRFYHGFGFPGRTDEYLPSIAVKQIMENSDPAKIAIRDAALKIMDKYMRKDEGTRLKYAINMQPSPTIGKNGSEKPKV